MRPSMQTKNVALLRTTLRQLLKNAILWAATALTSSRLAFLYVRNLIPTASKTTNAVKLVEQVKKHKKTARTKSHSRVINFHARFSLAERNLLTSATYSSNKRKLAVSDFSLALFSYYHFYVCKAILLQRHKNWNLKNFFSKKRCLW